MSKQNEKQHEAVYEAGKVVGWYSWTWNFDGTKRVRVFVPAK